MDERLSEIDVPAAFARSSQPIFLLNERGSLVFANPALHELFQIPLGNRIGWRELETGPLLPPFDLQPGGACQLDVQDPDGRWMHVVFHSLEDAHSGMIGVLGVIRPMEFSPAAPISDTNLFARWERLREDQRQRFGFDSCPARSPAGSRLLHQLKIAAAIDSPVLFLGEPGVGKLTLAKILHHQAKERGWSATLDAEVLDPEQQHEFLFSEGGVLFQPGPGRLIVRRLLSLSPEVQRELAEAHQSSDRQRRLLATEREPLEAAFADGRLNPALYYLVTGLTIAVPPLRERSEDIADFTADWLLRNAVGGGALQTPTPAALAVLERYDWPGNLREFSMVMASAAEKATGEVIDVPHLPPRLVRGAGGPSRLELKKPTPLDQLLEGIERKMLRNAHLTFRGNKSKAAEYLGLSRARFLRRWEQLKMDEEPSSSAEFNLAEWEEEQNE
jgi:DNA-binding NtrC family response regulator